MATAYSTPVLNFTNGQQQAVPHLSVPMGVQVEIGCGLIVSLELVTPEMADEWLMHHNRNNRRVRRRSVARLARKLQAGRWLVNHQGLALDADGNILDGQHRLIAIRESGVPALLVVFRGLPTKSVVSMDENTIRNVEDVFGKLVLGDDADEKITCFESSTARSMYISTSATRARDAQDKEFWIDFISRHREPILFATACFHGKDVKHCVFRAVVARAWHFQDRDRLREFGHVVSTGLAKGEADHAAVAVRNKYLNHRRLWGSDQMKISLYKNVESALRAFLEERPLTKIVEAKGELFPLPEEK